MMRDDLCSYTHNANAQWTRTLGIRTCHELAPPVGFTVQAEAPTTRAGKEATTSPPTRGARKADPSPRRGAATASSGEAGPSSSHLRRSFFKATFF